MNFQTVKQANGQNVNMPGKIVEFKGEGINQTSGKPWKKVNIVDDNNEKHQVTLRGTLPGPEMIEQRAEFAISTFQGNSPQHGAYQGFSGFWNNDAQVQPSQYSQQPPQQQGGQQPQQQASQPRHQPDNRQDDIRFAQALNNSLDDLRHGKIDLCDMDSKTNLYYGILKTRQFPPEMRSPQGVADRFAQDQGLNQDPFA